MSAHNNTHPQSINDALTYTLCSHGIESHGH